MMPAPPPMPIVPDVGSSTPAMMLKRVLFPQPLGAMTETNSPVATVRSIVASVSRRWRPEPNVFVTFCTSNFGESMLFSLIDEHVKGRNSDVEGCGLITCVFLGSLCRFPPLLLSRSGSYNIDYLCEYSEVGGIQYGVRPTLALSSR